MKRTMLWAVGGCFLLTLGCARDPYAPFKLGRAKPVVAGCVEAMGGLRAWRSVKPISAVALVTTYDADGRAIVDRQQHIIDLPGGTLRAEGRVPEGAWKARVTHKGKTSFRAKGFEASEEMKSRLLEALALTLHRLRGPLNLCGYGERAAGAELVHLGGAELIRVPVTGSKVGAVAYYFDAETNVLRLVTAGADAPGGEGTVAVYSYAILPNGMAFPSRISVTKIGKHVLIGDEPVLEVEYRQVRF